MLQHLQRLDDPGAVDILRAGVLRGGKLDLECALLLLPTLTTLLQSRYEDHALVAVSAVSQLVLVFGQFIRNTRVIARDAVGVDKVFARTAMQWVREKLARGAAGQQGARPGSIVLTPERNTARKKCC